MGERKVQCSYIPSDFNPNKAGRRSKPHNGQHDVRFMLPMSIQCSNCGDYMFQGTKANSRKELCYNEFYLGQPVYRFYIHCKNCYAEITIKTDPEHSDYIVEQESTRHFEPWLKVQLENIEEEKMKMQGSAITILETQSKSKEHELLQTEELERLVSQSRRKKRRLKKRDLKRIHDQESSMKHSNLTADDLKRVEAFRSEDSKFKPRPQLMKRAIMLSKAFARQPKNDTGSSRATHNDEECHDYSCGNELIRHGALNAQNRSMPPTGGLLAYGDSSSDESESD
ncbi:Coiled-coil domain-containing protein 94 [Tritrichomonas foetus]|uniref:Coiled-coil domain-containing protein 94 n=1 Tax=Tritrichomonas foetus TaxID=1144522 RepID=A0A1J4K7Y7_9EUKA|nr:Coiled-coil domain-containing protein 94 [Tritrichomonas foetus]|eukprot:OHT06992.1 Coiled-coil domain-containing protein 94 [Tritrichomonas foetus]